MFRNGLCNSSSRTNVYNVQSGTFPKNPGACTNCSGSRPRPPKSAPVNCFLQDSYSSSAVSMWWDNEGETLTVIEANGNTSNSNYRSQGLDISRTSSVTIEEGDESRGPEENFQGTSSVHVHLGSEGRYHSAHEVSMAASAAYIPGASLSDKLRLAASKGHVDKVQELLRAGAIQDSDREGRTALHYAALNGHGEIVQILADEGADINSQDTLGYTALHRAAAQGHLEVIKVLLSEACLINRQDEHGNSPLHEAAWNGYSKTLEVLLRQKANVHCVNKAGFSALHLAAQNGHNQSARVLLYAGCNSDLKNNYGDSALHTAARYGHAGVTRILISARCNISQQNKNGDTALHISAALKRRKLSKLLTECGINTTLKNKQNETAVDVARRKDHPDIILIITSQAKNGKKSKKSKDKNKKDKAQLTSDDTEKKGYFFKRKTKKPQAQEKEKEKIVVETRPKVTDHHSAPSEVSSSDFTSHMAPEDLLRGFRHTMGSSKPPRDREHIASARGTSTRGSKAGGGKVPIQGLLSEYAPKQGTQYYKDLAGNLKQGPIGYAPVCNCKPIIKKLEKKMEHDRNNLYDHIDASHKTLNSRIEGLDKRSAQQVYSIDKLTKERLDEEAREREKYVHACIAKDRMEMQDDCEHRHTKMKVELEGHIDKRFTNFERFHSDRTGNAAQDPCYWCYGNENHNVPHYHQDDMLNQNYMTYNPEQPPPPGKLYKSKSDETLSVASSHHSRKHWKLRANANANRDITDMKLAQVIERAQRMERKIRSQSAGVRAKAPPVTQSRTTRNSSVPAGRFGGRVSDRERGSVDNLQADYYSYKDYVAQQHQWTAKRAPVDGEAMPHFREASRDRLNEDPRSQAPRKQRSASQLNHIPVPQTRAFNGHGQAPPRDNLRDAPRESLREVQRENSREARQINEPLRTRSSSTTRVPDGSSHQVQYHTGTLPRPREGRPASSVYNINSNGEHHLMNGTSRPVSNPQLANYDNNAHQLQQSEGRSLQKPSQNGPAPEPSRANPPPPSTTPNPSNMASTPTPTGPPPTRWNPLHTSSPDPQPLFNTPDTTNSLISSQNSTPLYPSPANPQTKSRSESSSNPDSGYGSRFFGGRQISGPQLPGSASSSFQSSHGHNTSVSTNNTSNNGATSPVVQYEREPNARRTIAQLKPETTQQHRVGYQSQLNHVGQSHPPQQYTNVPGMVNRWYDGNANDQNPQQNNNRMWPPTRSMRQNTQTEAQIHHNGQPQGPAPTRGQRHESGSGFIGKATQV